MSGNVINLMDALRKSIQPKPEDFAKQMAEKGWVLIKPSAKDLAEDRAITRAWKLIQELLEARESDPALLAELRKTMPAKYLIELMIDMWRLDLDFADEHTPDDPDAG